MGLLVNIQRKFFFLLGEKFFDWSKKFFRFLAEVFLLKYSFFDGFPVMVPTCGVVVGCFPPPCGVVWFGDGFACGSSGSSPPPPVAWCGFRFSCSGCPLRMWVCLGCLIYSSS